MHEKFLNLKKHLNVLAMENLKQAEELRDEDKITAAEYFLGKTAAFGYAVEFIELILKEELPWEED